MKQNFGRLFFHAWGFDRFFCRQGGGRFCPLHLEGAAIKQGPLDLLAGFEADGRGERQRHINIEPGIAAFGSDRLDREGILDLHLIYKLVNKLAYKNQLFSASLPL